MLAPLLSASFFLLSRPPPSSTLFPYTTLFRSLLRDDTSSRRAAFIPVGRTVPVLLGPCFGHKSAACCCAGPSGADRKSTRLNSSHTVISYAVFCLKKKKYDQTQDGLIVYSKKE